MILRYRAAVVLLVSLAAGCATMRPSSITGPELHGAPPGIVVLFRVSTAGLPPIRMEIGSASAIGADGTRVNLRVVDPVLDPGESGPPRVHLADAISAGAYRGIELRFRSAAGSGQGQPPLQIPEAPVVLDAPFATTEGAAVVLVAELRAITADDDPGRFAPRFVVGPPAQIASGLLGIATVGGWGAAVLFDKRSGELAAVLPVGDEPTGIALDPSRLRGYIAVAGSDAVAVVDLRAQRVRERVALRAGDGPRDAALTPDGRLLLVANSGSDTVGFVDPISALEVARVAIAGRPNSILVDPSGARAFVTLERGNSIAVLRPSSRTIVASVPTEGAPFQMRFGGRNSETIFVAHHESPYVTVLDSATLTLVRRVYVGTGVRAIEVDRRSGKVFVARAGTGRVEVFDGASLLPVDELPVPGDVAWLAIESEGNGLAVLLQHEAEARILGILGGGIMTRAPLGPGPFAVRFLEAR